MATTLVSAPEQYQPAYNPIVFEFASTNYSQCEYNYVCDVYVNGAFSTRLKTFPEANGNGIFRIDRILQDYLSHDFNPSITDFTPAPNSICSYYVKVYDRYNTNSDCVGDVTLSAVTYTSSTFYAFNGAFQYQTLGDFTQTSHILEDDASQPLTDMPDNLLIGIADSFQMGFLHDYKVDGLELKTYDYTNTLIDTYKLTNPYANLASPSVTSHRRLQVGVGPRNINTTDFDGSPIPAQPIIDSTVKYYTITFLGTMSPSDAISITKRFEIDTRCSQFENFRLFWLNRLGDFDSYNFNLKSRRQVNVNRNTFTRSLDNTYTIGDRGTTVTSVNANEAYTVTSNWMSEAEALWLEELFTSPEVNLYTNEASDVTYQVTGLQYYLGYLAIQIDGTVSPGDSFTTNPTNLASFGITGPISGIVTLEVTPGIYKTNIVAPVDPSMSIISTGDFDVTAYVPLHIPVVITSNTYDAKVKKNIKNINYTIEFTPSYKINVQNQ